jgi:hypothetical protein
MRSIRLSLTLYFLALLSLALGSASLVVYRTARETLEAKKSATEELIHAQYRERCRESEARLDDKLYLQAQTLASMAKPQPLDEEQRRVYRARAAGVLFASMTPNSWGLAPMWSD